MGNGASKFVTESHHLRSMGQKWCYGGGTAFFTPLCAFHLVLQMGRARNSVSGPNAACLASDLC